MPEIVEAWSNVDCFTWGANFAIRLMRSDRIHKSLLLVLLDWIPKAICGDWHKEVEIPVFNVAILCILIFFLIYAY